VGKAEWLVVAKKSPIKGWSQGAVKREAGLRCQPGTEEPLSQPQPKPFCISKHAVLEAWERMKANKRAAGIDEESIRALRANSREPVSDLEPHVIGQLPASSSANVAIPKPGEESEN